MKLEKGVTQVSSNSGVTPMPFEIQVTRSSTVAEDFKSDEQKRPKNTSGEVQSGFLYLPPPHFINFCIRKDAFQQKF